MNNSINKKLRIIIWKSKFRLFFTQMVFMFFAAAVSMTVVNKGFYLVIKLSGYSAITKENYLSIMKTPGAIVYLLVLFILAMLLMLLNTVMIVVLMDKKSQKDRTGLIGYLYQVGKSFLRFVFSKKLLSIINFVPIIFAVYMPAIILGIYNNPVTNFLAQYAEKKLGGLLYVILLLAVYLLSVVFTVFRFPLIRGLILSDRSYKRVAEMSKTRFSTSARRLKNYLKWNLTCMVSGVALYLILIFIAIFVISLISGDNSMLVIFYEVYGGINMILTILIAVICGSLNIGAVTEIARGYIGVNEQEYQELNKKNRIVIGISFVVISVAAMFLCIGILLKENESTYMSIGQTLVSAHRGESKYAPENTIPAIEAAIENGADYVEIDVRITSDGYVVLMHDASTKRTTDGDLKVSESSYEELLALDAGSWFSSEYEGTKIPTLREAAELCKGHIMMNIELKPSDNSGALEEAVADIISEYNMESQCIVTSFNQGSIHKIKKANPDIVTGYIYTFGYSNSIEYRDMDVLSISSKYLTRDMVAGAHKKGIIVDAWTVNNRREMRRMVAIGVDNIITDNTPLAKKMIYEKNKNVFTDIWKYIASIYKK